MKHKSFIDYFWSFYGPNGLYPIEGLTVKQIKLGIELRGANFTGDTLDREAIRDIILVATNRLAGAFEIGVSK